MTTIAERISKHKRGDYQSGLCDFQGSLDAMFDQALKYRPRMSGSEWAEKYGWIPKGTGAESGPVTLYGYQRGLMDAMCDPHVPLVTVLKAARVGYTRCATLAIGYHLHQDPTLCAVAQPIVPDAEDFGSAEIGPMLRETPCLSGLLRPVRRGEKQDKATFYQLANGASVRLVGAAADDAFRRYSARFMFADEIDGDGWTPGSKTQGDKLKLFWTRGETFWNRRQVRGSTPLLEETSRIWKLWQQSDQRRYFVPCPQCGEMQFLEWGGKDTHYGIKWDAEDRRVQAVWYVGKCGCIIDEDRKIWMDARGEWQSTATPRTPGHAGFHLWTGMSLNPNAAWSIIVQEWLDAQDDPATLVQPFVNLRLGRTYKASYGQEIKTSTFMGRVEDYLDEVPVGVIILTAGVDVQSAEGQDPRIEVGVYGWGRGHERWLIGHFVLRGDPSGTQVWKDLDELLLRPFIGADGRRFLIQAVAIDSGGHHTSETYSFCNERRGRRIWAIKGKSEQNGTRSPVWPRKPSQKPGQVWYMLGGNAARDWAYGSLAVAKAGPRFVHFPRLGAEGSRPIDDEFFTQLTQEKLKTVKGRYTEWVKQGTREVGVCYVYAYAAVCGLQAQNARFLDLGRLPDPETDVDASLPPAEQEPAPETDGPAPEPIAALDPPVVPPEIVRPTRQHSAFIPSAQTSGWMQRRR